MTSVNTEVESAIVSAIGELLDRDDLQITRSSTFDELEIDSLDAVELRQAVRSQFGVEMTVDDLKQLRTVEDVIELVEARM